jgi:hypothetical protein
VENRVSCPHCGEPIDTYPDPGGGEVQEYIEDCSVCCRAIAFRAVLDEETGEFFVEVSPEI